MTLALALQLLALAAKYTAPAVIEIMKEWDKDEPITIDDINKLELKFKDPASYFLKYPEDKTSKE